MRPFAGARICGSVLGATALLAVLAGGAMAGGDTTLKVTSNTLLAADWVGTVVVARDGVTLDCGDHRIVGSGSGRGVVVDGRSGVTVRNCDVSNFSTGFFVADTSASTFEANRSHDNQAARKAPGWIAGAGFWIQNSSRLTLAGNVIYDNASDGLDLLNSSGNSLSFNATSDNLAGFFVFGARSRNNTLDGNTAEGNDYAGFVIAGASKATLTNNIAGSNVGAGFLLDGSSANTLNGNLAGSNRVGFAIANGSTLNTLQANSACGDTDIDAFQDATSIGNTFIGNSFCTSSGI